MCIRQSRVFVSSQVLQAVEAGLKSDIILLVGEKGREDLYYMTNVRLVVLYFLKGLPKGVLA